MDNGMQENIEGVELEQPTQEKTYDLIKFSLASTIPFAELMGLKNPEFEINKIADGLILRLHGYVITEKLDPIIVKDTKIAKFYTPRTWWDHFKIEHRHWWWIKLLAPPRTRLDEIPVTLEVDVQPHLVFPDASIEASKLGKGYRHITWREYD